MTSRIQYDYNSTRVVVCVAVYRLRGAQSMVDIIVATPGRLVDHINKTDSFSLKHLRYLVSYNTCIKELISMWGCLLSCV
jgi:hypothetical protein